MKRLWIAFLLLTLHCFVQANENITSENDAFFNEIASLDWKDSGDIKTTLSDSIITVPENHILLAGKEADTLSQLIGNVPDTTLEALLTDHSLGDLVFFSYINDGFVTIDDWGKIDSAGLLQRMKEGVENNNKMRKDHHAHIHVEKWLQKPSFNTETNTVYWATELSQEGSSENFFNSTALRLGRYGYEMITWAGDMKNYTPFTGKLEIALNAHKFMEGSRYCDYVKGDKVAGYGIASLVAATAGGKLLKAAGVLAFLKKFGAIIIAGLAGIGAKIKGFFRKEPALES